MLSLEANPSMEKQVYWSFRNYLLKSGFSVYPREFDCAGSDHPFVDLAGKMGAFYWAFEYKSETDSISRGLEQIKCYSEWFDYVVLVTERILDHSRSDLFWESKDRGSRNLEFLSRFPKMHSSGEPVTSETRKREPEARWHQI